MCIEAAWSSFLLPAVSTSDPFRCGAGPGKANRTVQEACITTVVGAEFRRAAQSDADPPGGHAPRGATAPADSAPRQVGCRGHHIPPCSVRVSHVTTIMDPPFDWKVKQVPDGSETSKGSESSRTPNHRPHPQRDHQHSRAVVKRHRSRVGTPIASLPSRRSRACRRSCTGRASSPWLISSRSAGRTAGGSPDHGPRALQRTDREPLSSLVMSALEPGDELAPRSWEHQPRLPYG